MLEGASATQSDEEEYLAFAVRVTKTGILSDPWLEGRRRFRVEPIVLSAKEEQSLARAAEEVGAVYNELVALCASDPSLIESFFTLTPFQRLMWDAAAPHWHGIARADVFLTSAGPTVCELNCDTPSGEAEAMLLNEAARSPATRDPNQQLGERFCDLVEAIGAVLPDRQHATRPLTIGIIYPTELTEDLSMILLYRRWFEARGFRVVLGSPYNLRRIGARHAALFDERCDVFVRHYKTDWWGERLPVWDDEESFADPQPLVSELGILLGSALSGGCAVVNPFGSVLAQNKRAMALMWEEIDRFPIWAQHAICRYVPFTARLEQVGEPQLARKDEWVLKSDYGCESSEVVLGVDCTDEQWRDALRHAIPGRWVAQRYFRAVCDARGDSINYGVYLVGGSAAGFFSRIQHGATNYHSVVAPTLIDARSTTGAKEDNDE